MHGVLHTHPARPAAGTGINAVVWVEQGRALVVRGGHGDQPLPIEVAIPAAATSAAPALAEVAHRIGAVDHVLVLGSEELRTALQREIVAIGHHPEVICEAVVERPVSEASLIAQLRRLT